MHIIVCVDDKNGMAFNKRRQSRDRILCEYLVKRYGTLTVDEYSLSLFDSGAKIGDFSDGVCFVEKEIPSSPDKITLCKWNRVYPADMYFDIPLDSYTLTFCEDIVGSSHERITIEEYEKTV